MRSLVVETVKPGSYLFSWCPVLGLWNMEFALSADRRFTVFCRNRWCKKSGDLNVVLVCNWLLRSAVNPSCMPTEAQLWWTCVVFEASLHETWDSIFALRSLGFFAPTPCWCTWSTSGRSFSYLQWSVDITYVIPVRCFTILVRSFRLCLINPLIS